MPKHIKKIAPLLRLPYWVFLLLFVVSLLLTISALRNNNLTMVRLRGAVYEADKNNRDVNTVLNNLRRYVHGHMNTNLASGGNAIKPPIQLKYTYERLAAGEQQRVDTINSKIYTEAQAYCQAQNPQGFSGRVRVPCVQDYVTSHGIKPNPIPAALYQFDFISPGWSPDLAGCSLVASAILFVAFAASFTVDCLQRTRMRRQHSHN